MFPVDPYACYPTLVGIAPEYSFELRCFIQLFEYRLIHLVLRVRTKPKLRLSVVQSVPAFVVNLNSFLGGHYDSVHVHNISLTSENDIADCVILFTSKQSPSDFFQPRGVIVINQNGLSRVSQLDRFHAGKCSPK